MKKSSKVKFGGGKLGLGGGRMQHTTFWSETGDATNLREIRKSPNRLITAAVKYLNEQGANVTKSDFSVPDEDFYALISGSGEKIEPQELYFESDYVPHKEYYTGHYQLNFSGKTTREIKPFMDAEDLQYIVDQDFAPNIFTVSSIGEESDSPYGSYLFESTTTGKKDFIKIQNQNDANYISGAITGHEGDFDSRSMQSLTFNIPERTHSYEIKFSDLLPNREYAVAHLFQQKDMATNRVWFSGQHYTDLSYEGTTGAVTVSYLEEKNLMTHPIATYLVQPSLSVHAAIDIEPTDLDEEVHITGFITGWQFDRKEAFSYATNTAVIDGELSSGQFYAGSKSYFAGSPYISFSDIKINNSSDLSGFLVVAGNKPSVHKTRNIELTNNDNLIDFYARDLPLVTGINLSGSNVSGWNRYIQNIPPSFKSGEFRVGLSDRSNSITPDVPSARLPNSGSLPNVYVPGIEFPMLRSLNLEGNNLDARGINVVLENVAISSSWTGTEPSGYINLKNQRNPWGRVVSGASGVIEILSGRNWIIDYDS